MGTVIVNGIEYDTATGAAIETEDTNTVNKNLENKEIPGLNTEVKTTETFTNEKNKEVASVEITSTAAASPISVLGQFTHTFIQSLFALPDAVVKEVAQELSDSLNLGWSDQEIFDFSDFVNKGKIGDEKYLGMMVNPEYSWLFPQPPGDKNIQQIMKDEGREAAILAMEEMGIPRNKFEKAAAIAGDFAAISALMYGGGYMLNVPKVYPQGTTVKEIYRSVQNMPKGTQTANLYSGMVVNDMMQFIRNNPGKAALYDLMGASGAGYALATVQEKITPEFRENHPFLASLAETGAMILGGVAGPFAAVIPGMIVTKGPTGLAVKFVGDKLRALLSLRSDYARRKFFREVQATLDHKTAKQLQPLFDQVMNNPALAEPQNMAMLIRQDIVGGEAVVALKNSERAKILQKNPELAADEAALEMAVVERLFALGAADDVTGDTITLLKKTVDPSDKTKFIYEEVNVPVGPFSGEALKAYEGELKAMFAGDGWKNIKEFNTRSTKPQGYEIDDWIQNKLYTAKLQLSMAEQTQDATIINLQQHLENTASGAELQLIHDRKSSNVKKTQEYWEAMLPNSKEPPSFIFNTVNKDVIALEAELIEAQEALVLAQRGLISPDGSPLLSGAEIIASNVTLREKLIQMRKNVITEFRKGDKDIRELKVKVPENMWTGFKTDIRNLIFEGAEDTTKLAIFKDEASVPPVIREIMEAENLTFNNMMDLYVRIGDDLFDATLAKSVSLTSRGKKNLYLVKKQFEQFLQKKLSTVGAGGTWRQGDVYDGLQALLAGVEKGTPIPAELVGKSKNVALKNYFDQYGLQVGQIFDKNAAYKIQRFAEHGNYLIPDEYFIHEFFKTAADVKQYTKVFGNDPVAMKHFTDTILDEIRMAAINRKTGELDVLKLNKWMDKNSARLSEMPPEFNNLLQNSEATMQSVVNRISTLNQRRVIADRTLLGKELRKISMQLIDTKPEQFGMLMDYNVSQLMNHALDNPNLMSQIYSKIRFDKTSQNAFKRLLWQKIGDRVNLENIPQLQKFLNNETIATSLKTIFNKNELKMLKKLQDSYQIIMTTAFPSGDIPAMLPIVQTITKNLGLSPQSLTSVMRATNEGRISPTNTAIYIGSRMLSAGQLLNFRKIYLEGLMDPQILDKLAKNEMKVSLFQKAGTSDKHWINRMLIGMGIKPLGNLEVQPEIISPNSGDIEMDQELLKWMNERERDQEALESFEGSSLKAPPINPASQLSEGVEMNDIMEMVSTTPAGEQVTEEQFASYFPHDTTGQMIAAKRAAEGGIMSVTKQQRQRVL
jgi:hypothetical protein